MTMLQKNSRFPATIRAIACLLIVAFILQDIAWAYPDIVSRSASENDKLAPESFIRRPESPEKAVAKFIQYAIENNGHITRDSIVIKAIAAILRHHKKWLKENKITWYVSENFGEAMVTFPTGQALRYFDPHVASRSKSDFEEESYEYLGNIHKQVLKPSQIKRPSQRDIAREGAAYRRELVKLKKESDRIDRLRRQRNTIRHRYYRSWPEKKEAIYEKERAIRTRLEIAQAGIDQLSAMNCRSWRSPEGATNDRINEELDLRASEILLRLELFASRLTYGTDLHRRIEQFSNGVRLFLRHEDREMSLSRFRSYAAILNRMAGIYIGASGELVYRPRESGAGHIGESGRAELFRIRERFDALLQESARLVYRQGELFGLAIAPGKIRNVALISVLSAPILYAAVMLYHSVFASSLVVAYIIFMGVMPVITAYYIEDAVSFRHPRKDHGLIGPFNRAENIRILDTILDPSKEGDRKILADVKGKISYFSYVLENGIKLGKTPEIKSGLLADKEALRRMPKLFQWFVYIHEGFIHGNPLLGGVLRVKTELSALVLNFTLPWILINAVLLVILMPLLPVSSTLFSFFLITYNALLPVLLYVFASIFGTYKSVAGHYHLDAKWWEHLGDREIDAFIAQRAGEDGKYWRDWLRGESGGDNIELIECADRPDDILVIKGAYSPGDERNAALLTQKILSSEKRSLALIIVDNAPAEFSAEKRKARVEAIEREVRNSVRSVRLQKALGFVPEHVAIRTGIRSTSYDLTRLRELLKLYRRRLDRIKGANVEREVLASQVHGHLERLKVALDWPAENGYRNEIFIGDFIGARKGEPGIEGMDMLMEHMISGKAPRVELLMGQTEHYFLLALFGTEGWTEKWPDLPGLGGPNVMESLKELASKDEASVMTPRLRDDIREAKEFEERLVKIARRRHENIAEYTDRLRRQYYRFHPKLLQIAQFMIDSVHFVYFEDGHHNIYLTGAIPENVEWRGLRGVEAMKAMEDEFKEKARLSLWLINVIRDIWQATEEAEDMAAQADTAGYKEKVMAILDGASPDDGEELAKEKREQIGLIRAYIKDTESGETPYRIFARLDSRLKKATRPLPEIFSVLGQNYEAMKKFGDVSPFITHGSGGVEVAMDTDRARQLRRIELGINTVINFSSFTRGVEELGQLRILTKKGELLLVSVDALKEGKIEAEMVLAATTEDEMRMAEKGIKHRIGGRVRFLEKYIDGKTGYVDLEKGIAYDLDGNELAAAETSAMTEEEALELEAPGGEKVVTDRSGYRTTIKFKEGIGARDKAFAVNLLRSAGIRKHAVYNVDGKARITEEEIGNRSGYADPLTGAVYDSAGARLAVVKLVEEPGIIKIAGENNAPVAVNAMRRDARIVFTEGLSSELKVFAVNLLRSIGIEERTVHVVEGREKFLEETVGRRRGYLDLETGTVYGEDGVIIAATVKDERAWVVNIKDKNGVLVTLNTVRQETTSSFKFASGIDNRDKALAISLWRDSGIMSGLKSMESITRDKLVSIEDIINDYDALTADIKPRWYTQYKNAIWHTLTAPVFIGAAAKKTAEATPVKPGSSDMGVSKKRADVEKSAAAGFSRFASLCREEMRLIRMAVIEGKTEEIASHVRRVMAGVQTEFGSSEFYGLNHAIMDSLNNLYAIQLFIGLKETDAASITKLLDDMENVLVELEKLQAAGRLMDANKAIISSGYLDASRVLKPVKPGSSDMTTPRKRDVRAMVLECLYQNGGKATRATIREWLKQHLPEETDRAIGDLAGRNLIEVKHAPGAVPEADVVLTTAGSSSGGSSDAAYFDPRTRMVLDDLRNEILPCMYCQCILEKGAGMEQNSELATDLALIESYDLIFRTLQQAMTGYQPGVRGSAGLKGSGIDEQVSDPDAENILKVLSDNIAEFTRLTKAIRARLDAGRYAWDQVVKDSVGEMVRHSDGILIPAMRRAISWFDSSMSVVDVGRFIEDTVFDIKKNGRLKGYDVVLLNSVEQLRAVKISTYSMILKMGLKKLIFNAAAHSGARRIEISAAINRSGELEIKVRDDGSSVPAKALNSILASERADAASGKEDAGIRFIALKDAIESVGGSIVVESMGGQGSAFAFLLPITAPLNVTHKPRWARPLVVSIGGLKGSGRRVVSQWLAAKLGLKYINAGFMYRVILYKLLEERRDIDINDENAVKGFFESFLSAGRLDYSGDIMKVDGNDTQEPDPVTGLALRDIIKAAIDRGSNTTILHKVSSYPGVQRAVEVYIKELARRERDEGRYGGIIRRVTEPVEKGSVEDGDIINIMLEAPVDIRARRAGKTGSWMKRLDIQTERDGFEGRYAGILKIDTSVKTVRETGLEALAHIVGLLQSPITKGAQPVEEAVGRTPSVAGRAVSEGRPASPKAQIEPAPEAQKAPVAPGPERPIRILVVDDEEMLRNLNKTLLRFSGFNPEDIVLASNGEEGLETFKSGGPFDIVLTDRDMPRMSGEEMAKAIRQEKDSGGKKAIIIMISGRSKTEEAIARVLSDGTIDNFLQKGNFNNEQFKAVFAEARRAVQGLRQKPGSSDMETVGHPPKLEDPLVKVIIHDLKNKLIIFGYCDLIMNYGEGLTDSSVISDLGLIREYQNLFEKLSNATMGYFGGRSDIEKTLIVLNDSLPALVLVTRNITARLEAGGYNWDPQVREFTAKMVGQVEAVVIPLLQGAVNWIDRSMSLADIEALIKEAVHNVKNNKMLPEDMVVEIGVDDNIKSMKGLHTYRLILTMAVQELLYNAAKYSNANRIAVTASISSAGELKINIRDYGTGIPHEKMDNIFLPGFTEASDKRNGTGYGLSNLREAVESVGGSMWAQSTYRRGALFSFTLPFSAPLDAVHRPKLSAPVIIAFSGLAGSGRGTISQYLAARLGLCFINRSDIERIVIHEMLKAGLTGEAIDAGNAQAVTAFVKKFLLSGRLSYSGSSLIFDGKDIAATDEPQNLTLRDSIRIEIDKNEQNAEMLNKVFSYTGAREALDVFVASQAEQIKASGKYNGIVMKVADPIMDKGIINIILDASVQIRAQRAKMTVDWIERLNLRTKKMNAANARYDGVPKINTTTLSHQLAENVLLYVISQFPESDRNELKSYLDWPSIAKRSDIKLENALAEKTEKPASSDMKTALPVKPVPIEDEYNFGSAKWLRKGSDSIPVSVFEDHDSMVEWLKTLQAEGLADKGTAIINFDTHSDAIDEWGALHIGSWVRWIKDNGISTGRRIWVASGKQAVYDRSTPEEERYAYGKDIYRSIDALKGNVAGPAIITIDYDYIASKYGGYSSKEEIEKRVREIVAMLFDAGIEPVAINFTYSDGYLIEQRSPGYGIPPESTKNLITRAFLKSLKGKGYKFETDSVRKPSSSDMTAQKPGVDMEDIIAQTKSDSLRPDVRMIQDTCVFGSHAESGTGKDEFGVFFASPTPMALHAVHYIRAIDPNARICDLGSGNGAFCFFAGLYFPDVTGIEGRKGLYEDSLRHRKALSSVPGSSAINFINDDFLRKDLDLSGYDALYFFYTKPDKYVTAEEWHAALREKLLSKKGLKPGARLIVLGGPDIMSGSKELVSENIRINSTALSVYRRDTAREPVSLESFTFTEDTGLADMYNYMASVREAINTVSTESFDSARVDALKRVKRLHSTLDMLRFGRENNHAPCISCMNSGRCPFVSGLLAGKSRDQLKADNGCDKAKRCNISENGLIGALKAVGRLDGILSNVQDADSAVMLIDELLADTPIETAVTTALPEKPGSSDMEYVGQGADSTVFRSGDMAIKEYKDIGLDKVLFYQKVTDQVRSAIEKESDDIVIGKTPYRIIYEVNPIHEVGMEGHKVIANSPFISGVRLNDLFAAHAIDTEKTFRDISPADRKEYERFVSARDNLYIIKSLLAGKSKKVMDALGLDGIALEGGENVIIGIDAATKTIRLIITDICPSIEYLELTHKPGSSDMERDGWPAASAPVREPIDSTALLSEGYVEGYQHIEILIQELGLDNHRAYRFYNNNIDIVTRADELRAAVRELRDNAEHIGAGAQLKIFSRLAGPESDLPGIDIITVDNGDGMLADIELAVEEGNSSTGLAYRGKGLPFTRSVALGGGNGYMEVESRGRRYIWSSESPFAKFEASDRKIGTKIRIVKRYADIPKVRTDTGEAKAVLIRLHELFAASLDSQTLSDGARILLSENLFIKDGDDRDLVAIRVALGSFLREGGPVAIMKPEEIRRAALRVSNDVTKEKMMAVFTKEDFENKDIWNGSDRATSLRSSVLIVNDKMTGDNYLYLEGVIGLARAVMARNRQAIKEYYRLISGVAIDDQILQLLKDDDQNNVTFAIKAILKFRPIGMIVDSEEFNKTRISMENALISA